MSRLEINPFLARFSAFRALTNGQQYLIGGIIFLATHFLWNGILRGVGMGSQAVPVVDMLQILCIPCALFYSPPENYGVADEPEAASSGIAGNRGEEQVQANVASQSRPPMHVSTHPLLHPFKQLNPRTTVIQVIWFEESSVTFCACMLCFKVPFKYLLVAPVFIYRFKFRGIRVFANAQGWPPRLRPLPLTFPLRGSPKR
ncbi:hypothetical protein B0H13DRAFT_2112980 [Mycena leptocephala]|nr:hypothetical protein B0H13DRAFT_2112980 [Mycena leptocephala]